MAVTPKRPGRHHHGDLRRALLDAVADIVLESGPEAVSLRECARRAGVSHSAAAPHFGDRRGLMTAFATERADRLRLTMEQQVAALPPRADARAVLAATGRGYLEFARANPAHFRLMFRTDQIDASDPGWRQAARGAWAPLEIAMAALLPGKSAEALAPGLALAWSTVHGFASLRAEIPSSPLWAPAVADRMIDMLVTACAESA